MLSEDEIRKEIDNMEKDYETMKTLPATSEQHRRNAMFCQRQVIKTLEWVLGKEWR